VTVTFSSEMPSSSYAAVVTIMNGSTLDLDYPVIVRISSKSTTGFTITLINPTDGSTVAAPSGGVTLNWIALPYN
jgi:hypothetical protein